MRQVLLTSKSIHCQFKTKQLSALEVVSWENNGKTQCLVFEKGENNLQPPKKNIQTLRKAQCRDPIKVPVKLLGDNTNH